MRENNRIQAYLKYHSESQQISDIDPAHGMLEYICDRFELNLEQRYWLAFVYALTYSGPSTFYVYHEFPDLENIDEGRLERWWWDRGRQEIICQTDRRWVRSLNLFVPAVKSYRGWLQGESQHNHFLALTNTFSTPEEKYNKLYQEAKEHLVSFGQFSLFLYLEALHTITPLNLAPTTLDLNEATSCRNGLCFAYGYDEHITESNKPTPEGAHRDIAFAWWDLNKKLAGLKPTVWQTETMLCAFKKYQYGKRYIGYYLDRQALEICKMEKSCPLGVAWEVLWQFRAEKYQSDNCAEKFDSVTHRGIASKWKAKRMYFTAEIVGDKPEAPGPLFGDLQ